MTETSSAIGTTCASTRPMEDYWRSAQFALHTASKHWSMMQPTPVLYALARRGDESSPSAMPTNDGASSPCKSDYHTSTSGMLPSCTGMTTIRAETILLGRTTLCVATPRHM
eukprot:3801265-Prorocentrum_lima.AAC.1